MTEITKIDTTSVPAAYLQENESFGKELAFPEKQHRLTDDDKTAGWSERPLFLHPAAPAPEAVKQPSFDWYWPEDDTSSDACADGPWQIAENIDAKPGEVFGYARGGVVEVRYFGTLPPADDSDSDDDFEVDEPTREAAEERMAVEVARRAALATDAEAE